MRPSFEVLAGDDVVATGTVGGDGVELPTGDYRVRTAQGGEAAAVTVSADQETVVRLGG